MFGLYLLCALLPMALSQNVGTFTAEEHLPITIHSCTSSGCTPEQAELTMDANWRWTHKVNDYANCYTGNSWDTSVCPDPQTCATNCALDGVDRATWTGTYGVTSNGDAVTLGFVTQGPFSKNIGSRIYLMASESKYKMFELKNKEIAFDVDNSQLPCGLNGAVYFVQMEEDGGLSAHPTNKAGAKYGVGYCDAQCPHDMKWINGMANVEEWTTSATDPNGGFGKMGTCCFEMDLLEANSQAQSYTYHNCDAGVDGPTQCNSPQECGDNDGYRYDGVCDKDGCDYAAYRVGALDFYGPGKKVDTTKKLTLVTQFVTDDGTDSGDLVEIRRVWVQNGAVIDNAEVNLPGVSAYDSITDDMCDDVKTLFEDHFEHREKGSLPAMGEALNRGFVLSLSLWADHYAHMHWLDAKYPEDSDKPGALRGPCPVSGGDPNQLINEVPNAKVTYSNIRYGPIGTTF